MAVATLSPERAVDTGAYMPLSEVPLPRVLEIDRSWHPLRKLYTCVGLASVSGMGLYHSKVESLPVMESLPEVVQNSSAHLVIGFLGAYATYAAFEPMYNRIKAFEPKSTKFKTDDFFTRYMDQNVKNFSNEEESGLLRSIAGGLGAFVANLSAEVIQAQVWASDATDNIVGSMKYENLRDLCAAGIGFLIYRYLGRKDHLPMESALSYQDENIKRSRIS